jgi:primosomal protein N' (replication factor Y) (superfamily II helicase)
LRKLPPAMPKALQNGADMLYIDLILNVPVDQSFTYSYTAGTGGKKENEPEIGKRAEVRFGNRNMTGFITGIHDTLPPSCPVDAAKIRPAKRIVDEEPLFTAELLALARWMADYYLCTPGEAVSAMLPSGRRESHSGGFSFDGEVPFTSAHELSAEQKKAVDGILAPHSPRALFHYLYGPTGSGKTEVFLQAAEMTLSLGKGVIYLVPEIGLTTQVIKAVVQRFGNTAAVLHSGLTPSQKLSEWRRIMHREARVVVGARSAVFAPVPDLGLVIIDEEHDASYKSGTTPRYHARQAAMYRCSKLGIPLVMGSATPSVESWYLMKTHGLIEHTVTKRLAGGAMPQITCIDLSKCAMNDCCISDKLTEDIRTTLAAKKQVILFLNRRGFTHFFRCASCGYEMTCKNCSVPMTYHKNENRLRCHYCGWSAVPPESCPKCGSLDIGYSGFGTEYIEAETTAKFPNARILRIDTDSLKKKGELEEKLDSFRRGEYDILLGTQMVAKGLNFPNLQLVGVVLADTGLHLPDFRASERTFSLITQVAGRAGRFFPDGKVVVQTYNPAREPVAYACAGNIKGFYEYEVQQRKMLGFPPFSRLIRLVFRSADCKAAASTAGDALRILQAAQKKTKYAEDIEIMGPAECPILKISQNYRYQILLRGTYIQPLQEMARILLFGYSHPQAVYIECDVDPVSLL